MEGFAIIKDEPLTGKVVSADYVRGYNDAVEKACKLYEEALYQSKHTGIHGIPQMVIRYRQAMQE